jgi:hypothetical protein
MSGACPGAEKVAAERWPDDQVTLAITKAATSPASLTTSGWASQLATTAVADFVGSLGPASAGATLLKRGLQLSFDSAGGISVPGIIADAGEIGFVAEGAPIPAAQLTVAGPTLTPRKFARLVTFTRETLSHSTPTVESLVRTALTESVALALDTALFDATAGDATRPAGLRNGIAAIAGTAGGGFAALLADLQALTAAVGAISGNGQIVLVGSSMRIATLRLTVAGELGFDLMTSSALADDELIAVAPNALASAVDPEPRFKTSTETVIHQEDATPLAIGTAGSPNTVAAPARSLWQTDTVGLRLILRVAWALRNAGGVAWAESLTW